MKNNFIKLFSLLICFALPFVLSSCGKDNTSAEETTQQESIVEQYSTGVINADKEGIEYEYFFESVEELNLAMKKDPDKYNNATVKIIGTLGIKDNRCYIIDYTVTSTNVPPKDTSSAMTRYEFDKVLYKHEKIEIIIANDAQYAVAEEGDFVKLYGTLKLTREAIYIDSCEYDLIATLDERIEMVTKP